MYLLLNVFVLCPNLSRQWERTAGNNNSGLQEFMSRLLMIWIILRWTPEVLSIFMFQFVFYEQFYIKILFSGFCWIKKKIWLSMEIAMLQPLTENFMRMSILHLQPLYKHTWQWNYRKKWQYVCMYVASFHSIKPQYSSYWGEDGWKICSTQVISEGKKRTSLQVLPLLRRRTSQ